MRISVVIPALNETGNIGRLVEETYAAIPADTLAEVIVVDDASEDATGSEGYSPMGIVPQAIESIKRAVPDLVVWADVCLCEYTDHGHCGVIADGDVDNDATLELLARAAATFARAGADGVAPSDMMDGRVAAIRAGLDAAHFQHVPIMSYACKFASGFYGPFRDAAGSTPQ